MEMSKAKLSKFTVFILAGGFGTRIRHIIGKVPKPLAKVFDKPFLYWIFLQLERLGVERVIVLTHYEADQIKEFSKGYISGRLTVECLEEKIPEGTGGALLSAIISLKNVSENLIVMNGDSLVSMDCLKDELNFNDDVSGILVGVKVDNTSRFGSLEVNENGRVLGFYEKKEGEGVISAGIYFLKRSMIVKYDDGSRPLSIEKDLFPAMIEAGENMKVLCADGEFIDIGTESSLELADEFIKRNFMNDAIDKNYKTNNQMKGII